MSTCVDLTNLREITGGDNSVEQELFQEFLRSSIDCLAALKADCLHDKDDEWRRQAHAFKGSSLNLGAEKLGYLCKEAQDNYNAPAEKKYEILAAIEGEFARVKEFLEKIEKK